MGSRWATREPAPSYARLPLPECKLRQSLLLPLPGVVVLEGLSRPVTDPFEQRLQGHDPVPQPEHDAASQTGPVRPAQVPHVIPAQRVRPERLLAPVQRDTRDPNRQFGPLPVADRIFGR